MAITQRQRAKLEHVFRDLMDPQTAKDIADLFVLTDQDLANYINSRYQRLEDTGQGISELESRKQILDNESSRLQQLIDNIEGR